MPSSTAVATTFLHEACTDRQTDIQTHREREREREREGGREGGRKRERGGMYNQPFTREELWSSGHNRTAAT